MKDRLIKELMIVLWEALKELGVEPVAVTVTTSSGEYLLLKDQDA